MEHQCTFVAASSDFAPTLEDMIIITRLVIFVNQSAMGIVLDGEERGYNPRFDFCYVILKDIRQIYMRLVDQAFC